MPVKTFLEGDILYAPNYAKVVHVLSEDSYTVRDVFSDVEYTLEGEKLLYIHKGCIDFTNWQIICQSKLVEVFLTTCTGRVFTVGFLKVDGTLRLLRGVYDGEEKLFGRTRVIDFDCNNEYRLVDHRTLQFLILNEELYISSKCGKNMSEISKLVTEQYT